jgi:flagellar hook protein FlgE
VSISSSLNASVAGLSANASQLATISDNIANSSTFGYKRMETDFSAMVIGGGSRSYVAGGVASTNIRLITERGPLVTSVNATDLAILGPGMLPVTTMEQVLSGNLSPELRLTTTGSFYQDRNGYLASATGHVLLGWPANDDGTVPTFPRDTTAGLQPLQITANQFIGTPTSAITLAANLPATSTTAGATTGPEIVTIEYFDNLGKPETLTVTLTPTVPATGSSNEWTMEITDSASGGALVGEYVMTFDDSRGGGGTLLSVATVAGGAYDAATGRFVINVNGGPIDFGIGRPGQSDGMTQLSDEFTPVQLTKNGFSVGVLKSVEVDPRGFVYGLYDNGQSKVLYQIPVVDVPNPNGLRANMDQTFTVSTESGPFFLWDAGDGPTGGIQGYSREGSNVDVASELTQLIQTQRAYSSNAKVIQTVDEMLQETTNLKR